MSSFVSMASCSSQNIWLVITRLGFGNFKDLFSNLEKQKQKNVWLMGQTMGYKDDLITI